MLCYKSIICIDFNKNIVVEHLNLFKHIENNQYSVNVLSCNQLIRTILFKDYYNVVV